MFFFFFTLRKKIPWNKKIAWKLVLQVFQHTKKKNTNMTIWLFLEHYTNGHLQLHINTGWVFECKGLDSPTIWHTAMFFFFLMLPYDVKTFVCQKLLVRFLFDRCPAHHPLKREVNCFSVGDIAAADRHSRYTIAVS